MKSDRAKRIRAAAYGHARRRFHSIDPEDFAQEAVLRALEGARGSIDQLFIDYLRQEFGDERVSYVAKAPPRAMGSPIQPDALGAPSTAEREITFRAILRALCENGSELEQRDRALIALKYKWGLTTKELCDVFGIGPTKLFEIFQVLNERIRLLIEGRARRKRR